MHLVLNGMRRSTGGEKGKEPDTAPDNKVGLGVENQKGQGKGKAMGIHRNVSLKKKSHLQNCGHGEESLHYQSLKKNNR